MSIHWTNKEFPFCHGEEIVEWDIRSANTSLMKNYNLASKKLIEKIEKLPKEKREPFVGNMIRKDREFGEKLEKAFDDIIEWFLKANKLDRELDVISIKKDAVFVRNRSIKTNTTGAVEFRKKGVYDGVLILPKYEIYHRADGKLPDIKGISDSSIHKHKDGMIEFIDGVFSEARDKFELQRFLKEYSAAYKEKLLPFDAYREFTSESLYRVNMHGATVMMDDIDEIALPYLDISYNYLNVYLEVLHLIIGQN